MGVDITQAVRYIYLMTNALNTAKQTAEQTLSAYETLGRELPEDMATWTPAQRAQMKQARDAYYASLKALNGLRGA
jgi:hypothetical protein